MKANFTLVLSATALIIGMGACSKTIVNKESNNKLLPGSSSGKEIPNSPAIREASVPSKDLKEPMICREGSMFFEVSEIKGKNSFYISHSNTGLNGIYKNCSKSARSVGKGKMIVGKSCYQDSSSEIVWIQVSNAIDSNGESLVSVTRSPKNAQKKFSNKTIHCQHEIDIQDYVENQMAADIKAVLGVSLTAFDENNDSELGAGELTELFSALNKSLKNKNSTPTHRDEILNKAGIRRFASSWDQLGPAYAEFFKDFLEKSNVALITADCVECGH